ncbi:regulatory protein RecX [Sneathiella sp.]|uniref:regulatory protein RecX n=1 Tax=Sneathiella sp. TaxID=1964365 RepID=UPI002FE239B4
MSDETDDRARRRPRKIMEPGEKWLYEQALRYLNRFAATSHKMRRHLLAKAAPHAEALGLDMSTVAADVETVIARLIKAGFLNDTEYAASKARLMVRDGRSLAQIEARLQAMEFTEPDRDNAIGALGADRRALDLKAAAKLVKKRRFGPYRKADAKEGQRERELASLARQGFSYDVAVTVIDAGDPETIEAILYGPADGA